MQVTVVAETGDLLGECPVWDADTGTVWWSDLETTWLYRADPASGRVQRYSLPESLGSFALRARGGLVCAFAGGLANFEPDRGRVEWIARPDPENRFNDGKCDPSGHFWAGTMAPDPEDRRGRLFRLGPDGTVECVMERLGIPNGLAWSPDGRRFFMADSLDRAVRCYHVIDGEVSVPSGRIIVQCPAGEATPDGAAMDIAGGYWSAEWEGGRILRYGPEGEIWDEIRLPVGIPTSCTFGGEDLRTLFITTARYRVARGETDGVQAGALLSVRVEVPGVPGMRYAG
jgi:sugar lactone lactonase YvrE